MKKCTGCGLTKETTDFYYESATDTYRSACKICTIKFNVIARQRRREGKVKLTMAAFRRKKMYL